LLLLAFLVEAAALDHEVVARILLAHDAMEDGAVIKLVVHVAEEVLDGHRRLVLEQLGLDRAHRGFDDDDGIGRPRRADAQQTARTTVVLSPGGYVRIHEVNRPATWGTVTMSNRFAASHPPAWDGLLGRRDLLRVGSLGVAATLFPAAFSGAAEAKRPAATARS